MSKAIRPNEDLRMGLIKSVYYSKAVQEYDPDYVPGDDEAEVRKPPVSKVMARAAWTGLVLQLVAILDDALEKFLKQRYPEQSCRKLGDRISFLKARSQPKWPERVQDLATLRNKLAHKTNFLANFDDWNITFSTVTRELEHLGIVANLGAPRRRPTLANKKLRR